MLYIAMIISLLAVVAAIIASVIEQPAMVVAEMEEIEEAQ